MTSRTDTNPQIHTKNRSLPTGLVILSAFVAGLASLMFDFDTAVISGA
ncbi:sugar porter family MFS transporter [Actinomyces ruminicola]|uniref:Uncharacterized protein n=1 Tax=Actinomyces ruminicola TaxID=332524 RepID=A0A1G9WXI1_9ACTO|nr:sugar porter family MFS transporter [Actinomyces ruminicola]SDM89139.1 hypothetical protein SAMN04487766_10885 [Actinomyces ruminicola]